MPTQFDSFKFINLYPSCPLPESISRLNETVTTSTLSDINVGVPFFWLLKSITYSAEYNIQIIYLDNIPRTFDESYDITLNGGHIATVPNQKICATPPFDGFISDGTFSINGDEISPSFGPIAYMNPFGQNQMDFFSLVNREESFGPTSAGVYVLLSSYQYQNEEDPSQDGLFLWKEISIPENPYITGSLYVGLYFIRYNYPLTVNSWDVDIESVEFWV